MFDNKLKISAEFVDLISTFLTLKIYWILREYIYQREVPTPKN